jgi:hypothetical protein
VVDLYETRRLGRHNAPYVLPRSPQLLVEVAHVVHNYLGEGRDLLRIQPKPPIPLSRRPAYYAAKDVFAVLVAWPDAVCN